MTTMVTDTCYSICELIFACQDGVGELTQRLTGGSLYSWRGLYGTVPIHSDDYKTQVATNRP